MHTQLSDDALARCRSPWVGSIQIFAALLIALWPQTGLPEWIDTTSDEVVDSWWDGTGTYTVNDLDAIGWDIDSDNASNAEELTYGSNPFSFDTDLDGLDDGTEIHVAIQTAGKSYSLSAWDSNGDGVSDHDDFYNFFGVQYPGGVLPSISGASYSDYDGDGVKNPWDPYPEDPLDNDDDGDGIVNELDPASEDPTNNSPYNNTTWYGDAIADLDTDGIPNYYDMYPEHPGNGNGDFDCDGILNEQDPYPEDNSNYSEINGIYWYGTVLGDADGDNIVNWQDPMPYLSENTDEDGDGLSNGIDPSIYDATNYSSVNQMAWHEFAVEDMDNDGTINFHDPYPEDPYDNLADFDGDGWPNEEEPFPRDANNVSHINGIAWLANLFGDDDGDGRPNWEDPYPYVMYDNIPDYDGDGILNEADPYPTDSTNTSEVNSVAWYGNALGDEDGDSVPNWNDETPYPNLDLDSDGFSNDVDLFPEDATNYSPTNGIAWYGDMLGDNDSDGVPNASDAWPDSVYNGNLDVDMDGIHNEYDPAPWDYENDSPYNQIKWYSNPNGDADADTLLNFFDYNPYVSDDVDVDGDGLLNSIDPFDNDSSNYSYVNGIYWYSDVLGDADGDGTVNWEDSDPYSVPPPVDSDGDGLDDGSESTAGTDPNHVDTDGDGLTDYEEVMVYGSGPINAYSLCDQNGWPHIYTDWQMADTTDSDADGLPDRIENHYGLNPDWRVDALLDMDCNGINNRNQFNMGVALNHNIQNYDVDEDGMSDVFEDYYGLHKQLDADATEDDDGDGILNFEEVGLQTSPQNVDTLLLSGAGDLQWLMISTGYRPEGATDVDISPVSSLPDWVDVVLATEPAPGARHFVRLGADDLDGDGMPDAWEHRFGAWKYTGYGLNLRIDDAMGDADGDGLTNIQEFLTGRDPVSPDRGSALNGPVTDPYNNGVANLNKPYQHQVYLPLNPTSGGSRGFGINEYSRVTGADAGETIPIVQKQIRIEKLEHPDGTGPLRTTTYIPSSPSEDEDPDADDGWEVAHGGFVEVASREFDRKCRVPLGSEPWPVNLVETCSCQHGTPHRYNAATPGPEDPPSEGLVWKPNTSLATTQDGIAAINGQSCINAPRDQDIRASARLRLKLNAPLPQSAQPLKVWVKISRYDSKNGWDGTSGYELDDEDFEEAIIYPGEQYSMWTHGGSPDPAGKIVVEALLGQSPEDAKSPWSASDGAGSRYRKVGLNGVPIPDSKPQQQNENGEDNEETYIDAFLAQLRHGVSDVYVTDPGALLPLSVRRDVVPIAWNDRSGLTPNEMPHLPFGAGWSSNLCSYITFPEPFKAEVVDELGARQSFYRIGTVWAHDGQENRDVKTRVNVFSTGSTTTQRVVMSDLTVRATTYQNIKLTKKFGTICEYEMVDPENLIQVYAGDRIKFDGGVSINTFARLKKVTDRWGNELIYQYPSSNSLVPSKIYDPKRPGHQISIQQHDGYVTKVQGPGGDVVEYIYTAQPATPALGSLLTAVRRGGTQVSYDYEIINDLELDDDPPPDEQPRNTNHSHLALKTITDERGASYSFTHRLSNGIWYWNGEELKLQHGSPLVLTSVTSPIIGTVSIVNNRVVQPDGANFQGAAKPCFTTFSYGEGTTDARAYTYEFSDSKVLFSRAFQSNLTSGTYGYATMKIIAPDGGFETYTFDENASMALKRVVDRDGNETTFDYEDEFLELLSYDDPTRETNELGHAKVMEYDNNTRILKKVTLKDSGDPAVNTSATDLVTEYWVDALGRRTQEKKYGGSSYQGGYKRTWTFGHPDFPGFATAESLDTVGQRPLDINLGEADPPTLIAPVISRTWSTAPQGSGPGWWRTITETQVVSGNGDHDRTCSTTTISDFNGNKRSVVDPRGQVTNFSYDSKNRLTRVTHPDGTYKTLVYDAHGNIVQEIDEAGAITFHEYDALNRRVKTTVDLNGNGSADGRYTTVSATAQGTPVYDGDLVTETSYNSLNLPVTITDLRGVVTRHEYDILGRLLKTTVNPNASNANDTTVTAFADGDVSTPDFVGGSVFDISGFKPLRITDARGNTTTHQYDALYRAVKTTRPDGFAIYSTYDKTGAVTSVSDPHETWVPSYTTDAQGRQILNGAAAGAAPVTSTLYDAQGLPVHVTHSDGLTTKTHYTPHGKPWVVVDEAGAETLTYYDALGLPVKIVQDEPESEMQRPTVETFYDLAGNARMVKDPRGNAHCTIYDQRNRPVTKISPGTEDSATNNVIAVTQTAYDAAGRVLVEVDPLGGAVWKEYDRAGRLVRTIDPLGNTTSMTLDAGGNVLTVTNPLGQTITNTFDVFGRLVTTTDAMGIQNEFGYDKSGNRTSVMDGLGQETTFDYDMLNRLITQTFANGDKWTHVYSGLYKSSQTDAKGVQTSYTYDKRGRMLTSVAPGLSRIFSYDTAGRLSKVVETGRPLATVEYKYDLLGRLKEETTCGVHHTYLRDLAGNVISASYGTGHTVTTTHDALNRPLTISEAGRITKYGYDLAGRAVSMVAANGQLTENVYDLAGRLNERTLFPSIGERDGNHVLVKFTWVHDALGNVVSQSETWPGAAGWGSGVRTTNMAYDAANRLVEETISDPQSGPIATSYSYDAAHNRIKKNVTGGSEPGFWTYDYNSANQLQMASKRIAGEGAIEKDVVYDYDANGNRLSKKDRTGKAFLLHGGVRFEAVPVGGLGDRISVSMQHAEFGQAASVQVNDQEVVVKLAQAQKARLFSQGITYQAKQIGVAGNDISIAVVEGGPDHPLSGIQVSVASQNISVMVPKAVDYASGEMQGCLFKARASGTAGNGMTVELRHPGQANQSLGFSATGTSVIVTLGTDEYGSITTTSEQLVGDMNVSGVSSLIEASLTGSGFLSPGTTTLGGGGVATGLARTCSQVVQALQADVAVSNLINLQLDGAVYNQTMLAFPVTHLSGGGTGNGTTGDEVVALVNGDAAAVKLVVASQGSPLPLQILAKKNLAGPATNRVNYTWDSQDRLIGVARPPLGTSFTYTYDYRTRRIASSESTTPARHTTFLFAGGLSLAEYESTTAQTTITTPTAPKVRYQRGPDMGGGVGGLLYSDRPEAGGAQTFKYNLSNGRGDIVAQSDSNGTLTWTASYEAYGKRPNETGNNADRQRANTKDEESALGLLNEGFRYRDLETGAWLSRDPAGFVDGPNLYAYVQQNPWTKFDPHGLDFSIANTTTENGGQHTAISLKLAVMPGRLDRSLQDPKILAQKAAEVKANIESHWTGGDAKRNMTWSMNVDIRVANSQDDIQPDEHILRWTADKVTSKAKFGGKMIRLGSDLIEHAGHETGHSLGLRHPGNVTGTDIRRLSEEIERMGPGNYQVITSSEKMRDTFNRLIENKMIAWDSPSGTFQVHEGWEILGNSGNNPIPYLPVKNVMRYAPLSGPNKDAASGVTSSQIDLINQYYKNGDLNGAHYDRNDREKWVSDRSSEEVFGRRK